MLSNDDKLKLDRLNSEWTRVINNTCNTIGCKGCPLKTWDEDDNYTCVSGDLQDAIMSLEMKDFDNDELREAE